MLIRLLVLLFCLPSVSLAATAVPLNVGSNDYVFIENNIDGGYLITPNAFSPRFTGSNVWTKYSTNQTSLGFMGHAWDVSNYFVDMWFDNSPINIPFQGLRCVTTGTNCPATGFLAADISDNNGFYHTKAGVGEVNGGFAYGSLSDTAYEYFGSRPTGTADSFVLNICVTLVDYDASAGARCKDETVAIWYAVSMALRKVGHITLKKTNAIAEVWVASDGTPSTTANTEGCYVSIVENTSGMTCRMVEYNYQQSSNITSALTFSLVLNTDKIGFTPVIGSIKFSGNEQAWFNTNVSPAYSSIFTNSGNGYVYVFMSNAFLKSLVDNGVSISSTDSIFTFNFYNAVVPLSGFYQFTASSTLSILPKEYGISITSSDGLARPEGLGEIGSEQPIELEYTVMTSAERQADSITAQVTGDTTTINSVPYCLFSSPDNTFKVPVPAWLSYTSQTGSTVKERNSCGESPIDMTNALWTQTPWDASADNGYFFSTNLKLLFPMNNSRSEYTLEGDTWMGTVSASGEIKVEATWIGVNR